jgi:hypothetical protein
MSLKYPVSCLLLVAAVLGTGNALQAAPFEVTGRLFDLRGLPLQNASVDAYCPWGDGYIGNTRTDATGYFKLQLDSDDCPSGNLIVYLQVTCFLNPHPSPFKIWVIHGGDIGCMRVPCFLDGGCSCYEPPCEIRCAPRRGLLRCRR